MNLRPATLADVRQLMTWFPDHPSLVNWGGPFQHWPIEEQRFLEDMHWGQMSACAADDEFSQLLAFGQYYERQHRCHLAFLAVAGSQRGKGLGQAFNSAPYPADAVGIENCLFMTREVDLKHTGKKSPPFGRET